MVKPASKKEPKKPPRKAPIKSKKKPSKTAAPAEKPLGARVLRFIEEYLIDLNGTQAAIRAGYSAKTATEQAARLLTNVKVQTLIEEGKKKRSERVNIKQDDVLRKWWDIATANANDLVEFRRGCCRFCWGVDHNFQWTQRGKDQEIHRHTVACEKAEAIGKPLPREPDFSGGVGYNANREPNPVCPECFGNGIGEAFFKDTRNLPAGATELYAGVKVSKEGVEVKMHSKDKALELIARHLGMLNDKLKLQGDEQNPLRALIQQVGIGGARLKPIEQPGEVD